MNIGRVHAPPRRETEQNANPTQETGHFGVKSGLPVDGVERMKNNAEITHYAIQNHLMD
jgi:hypothetical protein